jgi:hypothetical protein
VLQTILIFSFLFFSRFPGAQLREVEYWADWGTLLGVLRHRNVIPWDWDFDLSFRTPHFAKLLVLDGQDQGKYGWRWYYDPPAPGYAGYADPGYSIYIKSTENEPAGGSLGDIVEYKDCPDKPGEVYCAVESWGYPSYKLSDIYPLRRQHFLGTSILLPRNPKALLDFYCSEQNTTYSRVPVSQYDPVPFVLAHWNDPNNELHCSIPVHDAPETRDDCRPFVLRSSSTAVNADIAKTINYDNHDFTPAFGDSCAAMRVLRGRFEFLAIPPTHVALIANLDPRSPVDALLWDLGPSFPLWGHMIGGVLEVGDECVFPKGWAKRFRVIGSSASRLVVE